MISPWRLCSLLVLILAGRLPAADLQLASIFSDGAVLQRNQPLPIWGQGEPDTMVTVDFDQQHGQATVGADGWWRVNLAAHAAGGPYTLSASSVGRTVTVRDVLCGDVWLCSGQSNMQMSTGECVGGEQAAAESTGFPHLRLLTIGKGGADQPQRTFPRSPGASWKSATPESAGKFAAVGYFFAQSLLQDPTLKDVPIGLIDSSFGGTAAEAWTPPENLTWESVGQRSESMFGLAPSTLFNAMIAPLVSAGLSGVLWYQGESNAGHPEVYARVLTSMVQGWRQHWDRPDLPFFIVELPPYADKIGSHYYTWLREAQASVARNVPRCDLVVTLNTTDGFNLHPRDKQEIGRRAALLARRDVYGEKIVAQGPVFQRAKHDGTRLSIAFDPQGDALVSRHPERLDGFQLAGTDGAYFFADAVIQGDEVVVESPHVPSPETVRYAWLGVPTADLVNRDGLPAAPFRTDSLPTPLVDVEFQPTPVLHRLTTKNIDLVVDERGNIRSLGIGGQQFLSNSFGDSAGTCFPTAFAPRALLLEKLQPGCLQFHDDVISLRISADDEQTTWTITNGGKDDAQFRLTLANGVTATPEDGAVELSRVFSRVKVAGATDLQKPGPDGQPLMTTIPAHGTITLRISHQP